MAYIIKNILGTLRGTVAQVVFKKKGDLCYATSKPGKRAASKDPAAVLRMSQFKIAVIIASGINKLPLLKGLWPADPTKHKSIFQTIVGTNYKMINGTDFSGQAALTPSFGFRVSSPVLTLSANTLQFSADELGPDVDINPNQEKFLSGIGLILLKDPTDNLSPKVYALPFRSGVQTLDADTPIALTSTFNNKEKEILSKYTTKRAFFAMVTTDQPGNVVHYSETYGS